MAPRSAVPRRRTAGHHASSVTGARVPCGHAARTGGDPRRARPSAAFVIDRVTRRRSTGPRPPAALLLVDALLAERRTATRYLGGLREGLWGARKDASRDLPSAPARPASPRTDGRAVDDVAKGRARRDRRTSSRATRQTTMNSPPAARTTPAPSRDRCAPVAVPAPRGGKRAGPLTGGQVPRAASGPPFEIGHHRPPPPRRARGRPAHHAARHVRRLRIPGSRCPEERSACGGAAGRTGRDPLSVRVGQFPACAPTGQGGERVSFRRAFGTARLRPSWPSRNLPSRRRQPSRPQATRPQSVRAASARGKPWPPPMGSRMRLHPARKPAQQPEPSPPPVPKKPRIGGPLVSSITGQHRHVP